MASWFLSEFNLDWAFWRVDASTDRLTRLTVLTHVACARNQRKYALVHVNQRIQNMLTVSGVGEIIVSFATVTQAETSLA